MMSGRVRLPVILAPSAFANIDAAQNKFFVDAWEYASANQDLPTLMTKIEAGFNSVVANLPAGVQVVRGNFHVIPRSVYDP